MHKLNKNKVKERLKERGKLVIEFVYVNKEKK